MVLSPIRRCGFPVLFAVLLAGCSGSSTPSRSEAINLSGSVGDGPAVGAEITVTDARGEVIEQRTSDDQASYALTLPEGLTLPVRITAVGGTDLVTRRPLDFTLVGAALADGDVTVNLTPLGTLAVLTAECSAGGLTRRSLENAWQRVFGQLSMGLDRTRVADPIGDPVTPETVEAVVLANEAVGETVRRTVRALAAGGQDIDGDAILEQVACDLAGRPLTPDDTPVDPAVLATFKGVELGVRLETLARNLIVDDLPAMAAMDDSIRAIMPELPDPSVADVPVTADGRDQALALLTLFLPSLGSDALGELALTLDDAPIGEVRARVEAAMTPSVETDLRAFADNLAFADESELMELAERRAAAESARPPTVSLAALPARVEAGGSSQLSWATSNAEVCVAGGGWEGSVALEGVRTTGSLERSTVFELACAGLGGTARRSVVVVVNGTPLPEPDPLPQPDPVPEPEPDPLPEPGPLPEPDPLPEPAPAPQVNLTAADGSVPAGGSTRLSWTSSNASACTAEGGWSGVRALNGSASVGPLNQATSYRLVCTGPGGSASDSVQVSVDAPPPAPAPTVSLQAAALVVDDGAATQLSWSASNADSCSASGGWSGARATSGSASTGALNRQTTFTLSCNGAGGNAVAMISVLVNGEVSLAWQAPTENVDGTPLTDLGGYRIYYGGSSRSYTESVELMQPGTTSHAITLPSGQYHFAMTAVDADGNESAYSNEVVKVVD